MGVQHAQQGASGVVVAGDREAGGRAGGGDGSGDGSGEISSDRKYQLSAPQPISGENGQNDEGGRGVGGGGGG